jgi:hypothetical protein
MKSRELLPCPFCGGTAKLIEEHDHYWISHDDCPVDIGAFEDADDLVEAWNRRYKHCEDHLNGR